MCAPFIAQIYTKNIFSCLHWNLWDMSTWKRKTFGWYLKSTLMTQNQHPRSPGRYLMTLDFGWNTRNSQIPFLNETAIASISLVCQEWMEGNGSRSSENVFTSQFHLSCQLFLQEAFSSVFYMESRPGPITSDSVLAPNWPVRRRGLPITNCNHLSFFNFFDPLVQNHLQHVILPRSHKVFNRRFNRSFICFKWMNNAIRDEGSIPQSYTWIWSINRKQQRPTIERDF